MTRFSVDLEELAAVSDDLGGFEQRLGAKLAELDRLVAGLQAAWTGAAADAQAQAHRQWAHGAAEMHAALVQMRQAGLRAHGNYSAAAEANARMWRQVR